MSGAVAVARPAHESAVAALSLAVIAVIASAIVLLAGQTGPRRVPAALAPAAAVIDLLPGGAAPAGDPRLAEIDRRFRQAVVMLHARQYEPAVTALHRVLELSPRLVDAHVNMGYALLGLERFAAARDFFRTAIELRPYQGNAYWGLAAALEQLDDLPGALGAMRSYIHLAPPDDPYVRKARAALWEWEYRLTRGPLPKEEAEWLERRGRAWAERNGPLDVPAQSRRDIPVSPLP